MVRLTEERGRIVGESRSEKAILIENEALAAAESSAESETDRAVSAA